MTFRTTLALAAVLCAAPARAAEAPDLSLAARVLPALYSFGQDWLVTDDPGTQRAAIEAFTRLTPVPAGVRGVKLTVAGRPAELLVPRGAPRDAAILYLHGGAYVLGSINTHRALAGSLALAAGRPVLIVDYRLAPEHPFPAALDDALGAWRWLRRAGIPAGRLAVAGDSAGGGLTLALALRLRDLGEPLPAALVTFSPWTDLTFTGESLVTHAEDDPALRRPQLERHAARYVGAGRAADPYVSPVFGDYRGLPPIFIQVGEHEILLSDAERVAARAREAGVEVTYRMWPGMWHVWHAFPVPEAQRAFDEAGAYFRARVPAASREN